MAGKGDVITAIAEQAGISKKEASGNEAPARSRRKRAGSDQFAQKQRKAREGRNPRTKEKINIPASKNVRFKAGKDLRDSLNTKRGRR